MTSQKKIRTSKPKYNGKHPGGAPIKYNVDTVKLGKLARIGCTYAECADILGVSTDILEKSYSVIYTKGRENLKERLRRKQIKKALEGNVVMLIWLGKQYLEQKDKADITSGNEALKAGVLLVNGETITHA
jgi:hypothetical protein